MIIWLVVASFISVNVAEIFRVPLKKKVDSGRYQLERKLTGFLAQRVGEDLSNFMNTQYYGKLDVGTPSQTFQFMFDTGSSDTWVLSSSCGFTNIPCLLHWNKYNHEKSSTYRPMGDRFVIPYAQGTVGGFVSVDKFHMANMTIVSHPFGEIDQIPVKFIGMRFEGIVGLGFSSLSVLKSNPFFYNLLKSYPSMKPIFSFYLGTKGINPSGVEGELIFGDVDPRYFKGPLITAPVVNDKYWAIKVGDVSVGSLRVCDQGCVAVIDTGTSLILGPSEDVNKINLELGAKPAVGSMYMLECDKLDKLPNIDINIKGHNFQLSKDQYVMQIAGQCFSALMGLDMDSTSGDSMWIFGDVFIRRYYTVFNLENRTISFAEAATFT